ncbi:TPA: hypothetical protein MYR09_002787 [Citrobacter farmeri]|uniref:hypothetical protein n=1 Tax=Citrobacter farmeri TaxID=67824 RepID=UPI00388F0ED4|nr:hypothetical protein [Citrobacter farmeri]
MFSSALHPTGNTLQRLLGISCLLIFIFFSTKSMAMLCRNNVDNSALFQETLSKAAVPVSEPDGSLVWRSKIQKLTVRCWDDSWSYQTQGVYAYFNPDNAAIGDGVELGININGVAINDLSKAGQRLQIPGVIVPACNTESSWCQENAYVIFDLSYYISIRKRGNKSSGNYTGSDTLDFFQLDGSGGLNMGQQNYRYRLSGLQNIRFIGCGATVDVHPTVIDFGAIPIPAVTPAGTLIKSQDFSIDVSRSCNDPFKLTALYTTTSTVNGQQIEFNNMYLKLKEKLHDYYVDFSDLFDLTDFADLSDLKKVTVPFSAELYWDGTQPTAGNYSVTVTVAIFYN